MNNNKKLEEYINFNLIYENVELNEKKIIDIYESYNKAKRTLKLLNELNIEYEITLIGGALRDLICEKKIKDYDFLINIQDKKRMRSVLHEKFGITRDFYYEIVKKFSNELTEFNKSCIEDIIYNPTALIYREKTKEFERVKEFIEEKETEFLFKKVFESNNGMNATFFEMGNRTDNSESYVFISITSIIKLDNLDLILTEVKDHNYVTNFDFEICKVFLPLSMEENITKEKFINYLHDKMIVSDTMIEDVKNKTITYSVDRFNEKEIERSINKHYFNIKDKYKEYEVIIQGDKKNRIIAENFLLKQVIQKKEDIKIKKYKI